VAGGRSTGAADPVLEASAVAEIMRRGVALEQRGDHWALVPVAGRGDRPVYGAAVDIGTTTVVVLLVDLANGEVVATASRTTARPASATTS